MGKNKEIIKLDKDNNEICRYYNAIEAYETENISKDKFRKTINKEKYINGYKYVYSGRFSDEVDTSSFKYKCPYCDKKFLTYNGLTKHVIRFKKHGESITQEKLLADFAYGGVRPKCKCGCGEYTEISYENGAHFCDYKLGHHSRVYNNWGNNPLAIKNSAKTRKEQYSTGDRIQWNKGKTWEEVYDKETINRLSSNLIDKLKDRLSENKFSISSQLEDSFIENYIKPLNVKYIRQFYIDDIKQFCDIFIPDYKVIIEINGGYWHCDPRFYNGAINKTQQNKIDKDIIKYNWVKDNNYKIIVIWEYDIINNINQIKKQINDALFSNNKSDWESELYNYINSLNVKTNINFYSCDLIKNSELYVKDDYNISIYNNDPNSVLIFEDEWRYKKEITESRINNLLGINKIKIFARKCVIKELKYSECKDFMNNNHIQGAVSGKYYLGLFYNNELVSLMTFGDLRINLGSKKEDGSYELLRFCNKLNTSVIGGASKLFKYFIKIYNPIKIISYCDKRWSRGKLYETLGFNLIRESKPNYFYVNNFLMKRENRFKYRKDKLVADGFEENQTEREIMKKRMIYRIYDCGCKVYEYNN